MKKIALALTLLLFSKAFADFDRHLFKNSQLLEDSALVEDEKIRLNCFVFKNFIILEKEEPGFLGKVIYFKENKIAKNTDVETYCKDIQIPSFKKLESSGASFYGLYKGFLFVQDPDELSARTKFEVHNLESGQMTFSGVKNNDTMLKIVPVTSKK